MKRYLVKYNDGGREVERQFASKPEAFRWFNWECPADEAVLQVAKAVSEVRVKRSAAGTLSGLCSRRKLLRRTGE